MNQRFFEDVVEGEELTALVKNPTTVHLFMYCAAVWLPDRIHFDWPFATARRGLPGVVLPGPFAADYYVQLLCGWAGSRGKLRKLSTRNRSFMVVGDTFTWGGKVTAKTVRDGRGYVDLALWSDNGHGVDCAPGTAVVELPLRMPARRFSGLLGVEV